ncbi:MAG: hypothetical protein ACON41_03475 [Parvibaculales bacterium]
MRIEKPQSRCVHTSRRHFLLLSLASTLYAKEALAGDHGKAGAVHNQVIAGSVVVNGLKMKSGDSLNDAEINLQTTKSSAIIAMGSNVFLVSPESDINFELDGDKRFTGLKLGLGAVHSVFTPKAGKRVVKTPHATIGIRGTGHYAEVQPDHNRTYSCCCYGAIEIENNASGTREAQQTSYHEARIITAAGGIEAAPYDVPLNHYDDSLVHLEKLAGREPHWTLPNGELIFFNPNPLPK